MSNNSLAQVFPQEETIQDDSVDFASLCKEIREYLAITQTEMAQRLGVSLRGYQRWENGDRKPHAEAAYKIALMETGVRLLQRKAFP